jgi:hypothetical protein
MEAVMARFLRTSDGRLINTADIEEIRDEKDDKGLWRTRAYLRQGSSAVIEEDVDRLERALLPVVPAAPGFALIQYLRGDGSDEETILREPVVAWRVHGGSTMPVEPVGLGWTDTDGMSSVVFPDGSVYRIEDSWFANEQQWLEAQRREWQERKARKA